MQVNVFIAHKQGALKNQLLVLPLTPEAAISAEYRTGWQYYATVNAGDRMFGELDPAALEAAIVSNGFQ